MRTTMRTTLFFLEFSAVQWGTSQEASVDRTLGSLNNDDCDGYENGEKKKKQQQV